MKFYQIYKLRAIPADHYFVPGTIVGTVPKSVINCMASTVTGAADQTFKSPRSLPASPTTASGFKKHLASMTI